MNRLQFESSPYLLQHAHNPVDWYPWSDEAFERARTEQKPVLVSIGYSTCHWCHVMERESFENPDVAAFMNENFINIKVDREERPDVDAIYMEACQLLTGSGGWPLNCFLTPMARPFYAGTYFPPRPAFNRPSWLQLLQHLTRIWNTQREVAIEQSEKLLGNIRRNDGVFIQPPPSASAPKFDAAAVFARIREQSDFAEGGFGGAPKFPSTMTLQWLLQWHHYSGNAEALSHAVFSLEKMMRGGIYDQIGGGFARYATDRAWLIPHFEKMLYDNALLVKVLAEAVKSPALSAGQVNEFTAVIHQTLAYIEREMTDPDGGFFAAQDADSEGEEGKFYIWSKTEIESVLSEDAALFCAFYGVSEAGNWEGHNILWCAQSLAAFAGANNLEPEQLQIKLSDCAAKLLERRSQRVWPGLDHKILVGWNALMVSGYAAAYTATGRVAYRSAALRNLAFLERHFRQPDGSWKHSASQRFGFLEDYAWLIAAWLDVYQIDFNTRWLSLAETTTEYVLSHFYEEETGLFFFTDVDQTDILFRKKDLYDNATPSGNSTMAQNLQRLGILLDRRDWREIASCMLSAMRATVEKYPLSFARWGAALLTEAQNIHEIAVVGDNAIDKALEIQRGFFPNMVIAASREPSEQLPLLAGKSGAADALIYVCRDFACQRPVATLEEFRALVNSFETPTFTVSNNR